MTRQRRATPSRRCAIRIGHRKSLFDEGAQRGAVTIARSLEPFPAKACQRALICGCELFIDVVRTQTLMPLPFLSRILCSSGTGSEREALFGLGRVNDAPPSSMRAR